MSKLQKKLICLPFILILFFTSACAKDIITGKSTYNVYSVSSDISLGQDVMRQQLAALKSANKEYDTEKDKQQRQRIEKIVKRIGAVSHYPNFPYEVHVADVDIVNAWCAPGGKIMVYEGLWDPKKGLVNKNNDDELAAVLAHEIAHATGRHVTEMLSVNMTLAVAGTVAESVISSGSSSGAGIFREIFTQGFNVFVPTYSRKNEYEADKVGLIYMAKAGYDPRAAVELWEKASKRKGDSSSIYSTHPSSGARAAALKKDLPEALKYYYESSKKLRSKKKG